MCVLNLFCKTCLLVEPLVYVLTLLVSGSRAVNVIKQSINNWNSNTCLNIRPARSNENNRIRFVTGGGCSSYIGTIGGPQDVTLANGCLYTRIVDHEIGHAVGFYHEQSRPDRDTFVEIVNENILPPNRFNFDKQPETRVNNFEVEYDYLSVMHYGRTAFSQGGITIRTRNAAFQNRIGESTGLSFRDIKLANLMYNCNSGCSSVTCPGEGFQADDCNCRCPTGDQNNPIRVCDAIGGGTMAPTTPRPTTRTVNETCMDNHRSCRAWAGQGYCQREYVAYMSLNCKQSCNTCGVQVSCVDFSNDCDYWRGRGYCEMTYVTYMRRNCPRACGVCTPQSNENEGQGQVGENENQRNMSSEMLGSIYILALSLFMAMSVCWLN